MTAPSPQIRRGEIYRGVIEKRDEEAPATSAAQLEVGRLVRDRLEFADDSSFDRALRQGILALEVPGDVDLSAADEFAATFYVGDAAAPYGRFRSLTHEVFGDPLLGFHQRVNQIEQFLLERRFWASHYPPEIRQVGEALVRMSRAIVSSVLHRVRVPEHLWAQATGGCTDGDGSYHLTFNHYRPTFDSCGLASHKDDGFLTILRASTPGLEVNRDDHWEWVPTDSRHFILNFGLSMELLTARAERPVAAIMHRVRRQASDRSSFGHFTSSRCVPGSDAGIYRFVPGAGLDLLCNSRDLIDENDAEIYQGTRPVERS